LTFFDKMMLYSNQKCTVEESIWSNLFTMTLFLLWRRVFAIGRLIGCVVFSSVIYGFCLPLWYLLAIVLSVLLWYTDSAYPFGIFWPLCCLFFCDILILLTPLVSFAKRYQSGKQNPYITEEQKTQWPKDTKGVSRIRISQKNRKHNGQNIPKG
jgi:hypothetical protein